MLRTRLNPPRDTFPVDPWAMKSLRFTPEFVPQAETAFALANGYLGLRGSFSEDRPAREPGTYLNGFHELRPIVYGEHAFGFPKVGQTMLNCPDGKIIKLYVDDEPFDLETIASHLILLIIGGAETFPKTFANTTQLLAEHPDQRARVAADLSIVPDAFQEALRYWMPTQFLCRTVTNDLELRGKTLKEGQPVLFLYPSANRDDDEFDNPDVFDIDRGAKRILSFGAGTHACVGMHAARLEAKVCLEEMLSAFPEYEIDLDNAEKLVTDFVQGYASFPIKI